MFLNSCPILSILFEIRSFELDVTCDAQRRLSCIAIFGSSPIFGCMHHPLPVLQLFPFYFWIFTILWYVLQLLLLYFWIFTILGTQEHIGSGSVSFFKQRITRHIMDLISSHCKPNAENMSYLYLISLTISLQKWYKFRLLFERFQD